MNCFKPTIKTVVEITRRYLAVQHYKLERFWDFQMFAGSRRSEALDAASATGNLNAVKAQQLVFFAGGWHNLKHHIVELSVASIK